ncbi:hypothetical protein CCACVL1_17659 [Corchorus capsularis]|uniref:Uncharacterized protein n=1 Tax=Corchorus capsularis TaxID=210143 RepID=A0A1R3HQQ7_COCAP|nr:hypothetical protein CCACVL1_17659 [Corchorus capsularis]
MQGTQAIDDYTSWLSNNHGIGNSSEELDSLFDICYRYPVSDPDSPLRETVCQIQPEKQSDYGFRYWLSELDSCCGGYWGDDIFSGKYSSVVDDQSNDPMVKTEEFNQSENQLQSYTSYSEGEFSHQNDDFNPWSSHQYFEDDDSYSYTEEEPRNMHGYRIADVGICDGIFGYFPCLLREQQQYNNMQW